MPAIYRGLDLQCSYPENWKLSEDRSSNDCVGFTIDSPDAAFFALTRYPWTAAPRQVLDEALPAMKDEYQELEAVSFEPSYGVADSRGLEIHFYCLDLLVRSKLVAFSKKPYTYLIQSQAEDRTFERLEPVFEAMITSILRSLPPE